MLKHNKQTLLSLCNSCWRPWAALKVAEHEALSTADRRLTAEGFWDSSWQREALKLSETDSLFYSESRCSIRSQLQEVYIIWFRGHRGSAVWLRNEELHLKSAESLLSQMWGTDWSSGRARSIDFLSRRLDLEHRPPDWSSAHRFIVQDLYVQASLMNWLASADPL